MRWRGIGPVAQLPTIGSGTLGSNVRGLGPAFVVVELAGPVVAGVLVNNVFSLGGTKGRGGTQYNRFLLQPFFNYNSGGGWRGCRHGHCGRFAISFMSFHSTRGGEFPMQPIVRVSILRCPPDRFAEMRQMMIEAETLLRPGIESMRGLLAFYVGADEATASLSNVSLWTDLEAAKQLDRFQPMLDSGKPFVAKGATFERPIMNYATLWQLQPVPAN